MANLEGKNHHIALFKGKEIRKIIHKKEWWFSILDIIGVLTDSPQPKTYWAKMKERDEALSKPFPFWEQLKMPAPDGKMREQQRKYIEPEIQKDCHDSKTMPEWVDKLPARPESKLKGRLAGL